MNQDESVTEYQLILLRKIMEGEEVIASSDEKLTRNLRELAGQDLIEIEEREQGIKAKWLTTKALRLMAESGIFYDRTVSRAEEVIKFYGVKLKLEKVLTDIEKVIARSDISNEEKLAQTLGLIRHSRFEPTF